MYINNKELTILSEILKRFQALIDDQEFKNQLFVEGIFNAMELANEGERVIENIERREVMSRAKKIVRNRMQ